MRLFVDHCVPQDVTRALRSRHNQVWTAYEAHLNELVDRELIYYAHDKDAIAVTINKDFAQLARRLRAARVIYLAVTEQHAVEAMERAEEWEEENSFPAGRVLRVPLRGEIRLMSPR